MADTTGNTSGRTRPAGTPLSPASRVGSTSARASSSRRPASGAGDLVATLIAGSNFGYTLLWAAIIGCLVKISLAEAAGRWHLSTGPHPLRRLGEPRPLDHVVLRRVRRGLGLRLRRGGDVVERAAAAGAVPGRDGPRMVGHRLRSGRPGLRLVQQVRGLREGHDGPGGRHVRGDGVPRDPRHPEPRGRLRRPAPGPARREGLDPQHPRPDRRRRRHHHARRVRLLGQRQGLDRTPAG